MKGELCGGVRSGGAVGQDDLVADQELQCSRGTFCEPPSLYVTTAGGLLVGCAPAGGLGCEPGRSHPKD